MERTRSFILLSIFVPAAFLLSAWGFVKVYEPDSLRGDVSFESRKFGVYSVDGAYLVGTHNKAIVAPERPLFFMVAAPGLDRDWNAPTFSFSSGRWLAGSLGSFGIDSIRYDQRGTGQGTASKHTKHDFELHAEDLRSVYRYALKQKRSSLVLLAHGNGCALALYALEKWSLATDGLILLSCGTQGNLLEAWARKLFFNMRRKGVKAEIITRAKEEWQLWKDAARVLPIKDAVHPDLGAFRTALQFLSSDARSSFRKRAKNIFPFRLIRKQVLKGNPVLHLIARYDEERPPEDQAATHRFAKQLQTFSLYRFREIDDCDHFLKEQERLLQGFALTLTRSNPLRPLQSEAVALIRDAALAWDEGKR